MRRLWIGIILLAALLAGGIGMLLFSRNFCEEFSGTLETAAQAALAGEWAKAEVLTEKITGKWERNHKFLASFTDHEPMEEVEQLLSRLRLFQKAQLGVDFADTCQMLRQLCEAIDESHNLRWWSLL